MPMFGFITSMEFTMFFTQYSLFLLKSLTVVVSTLITIAGIIALSRKPKPTLEILPLNKDYKQRQQLMQKIILGTKGKKLKKSKTIRPKLYVIDFNGDIKASQVQALRDEISAILSIATNKDEVLIRLESPGGSVNAYCLASSQLQRIRDHKITLTVCVDKLAASGGYLMACVAQRILAAPFAIIGSIGVVAQLPNLHRWLKKQDIDVEVLTAGEYKRTLTIFGENTDKGRKKFIDDLEQIHHHFRDYVAKYRDKLNIDQVATGEHWLATDALKLNLIDELQTSDDYLIQRMEHVDAYQVIMHVKQPLINKLLAPTARFLHCW